MSKEVVNKETGEVAAFDPNSWGSSQFSSQDIVLPRISLMQPMSDMVTSGKATFGQFVESLANEVLGDFKTTFDVVPFHMEKLFKVYIERPGKKGGGTEKEWLRNEPITPQNESLPYTGEEMIEGRNEKIVRDRTMNFYVLLVKDLTIGAAIPNVLSFSKSSIMAGKKLATQMYIKNVQAGKTPASMVCTISAASTSNDKGTYAVADVKPTKVASNEFIAEAFRWLTTIKGGRTKVDESVSDVEGELEVEEIKAQPVAPQQAAKPPPKNSAPQTSEQARTGRF